MKFLNLDFKNNFFSDQLLHDIDFYKDPIDLEIEEKKIQALKKLDEREILNFFWIRIL